MTLTVPTSTVAQLAAATSNAFDQLFPLILLLLSVPLVFYVSRRILALFPKPSTRR